MAVEREEEQNSVSQDVVAAAAELAKAPAAPEPAETPEKVEAAPDAKAEKPEKPDAPRKDGRDETGRFTKKESEAKADAKPEAQKPAEPPLLAPGKAIPALEAVPPPVAKPALEPLKAPASWKPLAREKWSSLPREVQEEAIRVDREVRKTFEETAPVRKRAEAFESVFKAHEPMYRARNLTPEAAFESYARTDAVLTGGTAEQKAHVIAQLLTTYGLTDQAVLDRITHHLGNPQAPAPVPFAPQRQQPVFDESAIEAKLMQRLEAQQTHARAQAFVESHEFATDLVKEIDAFVSAGAAKDWEEAYALALDLQKTRKTEIGQILLQREEAKRASQSVAAAETSKAAAVSVKSSPTTPAPAKKKSGRIADDMREALEELNAR